ncbi:hypothetical protein ACIF9R_29515 [Streptomyces sp. NPDC086080]|uniref:hypothetical protein n=1 Tax=Streptomyces sp. NPDC086080 TaxID=3365748 RepID=UPI0037D21141
MVAPVLIAPVLIAPVLVAPVLVAPVLVAPVLVAPVLAAPVLAAAGHERAAEGHRWVDGPAPSIRLRRAGRARDAGCRARVRVSLAPSTPSSALWLHVPVPAP